MKYRLFLSAFLILLLSAACRLGATPAPLSTATEPVAALPPAPAIFSGRAYVDANSNQELDKSDPPLAEAQLLAGGYSDLTDESGYAQVVIPGGWSQPLSVRMLPPADSSYVLIGPAEVELQEGSRTEAEFLFAALPAAGPEPEATVDATLMTGEREILRNLVYCTTTEGVELKMDIHYPQELEKPAPLVVYVHGGGWIGGDKNGGIGRDFAPLLLQRGYVVAAINYRLSPQYQFPAHIQDVQCAIRHLRFNAKKYGIDPQRIAALGGSAGGHLVALLGTADENAGWPLGDYLEAYAGISSRVQAVVDLFGPTDLVQISSGRNNVEGNIFGARDLNDPKLLLYSPLSHVTPDDPPFLILHGDKDGVVPLVHSQLLLEKLEAAGVPSRLVVVLNSGHSFKPTGGSLSPKPSELQKIIADFLDDILK